MHTRITIRRVHYSYSYVLIKVAYIGLSPPLLSVKSNVHKIHFMFNVFSSSGHTVHVIFIIYEHSTRTTNPIHFYYSDFHENFICVRVTTDI